MIPVIVEVILFQRGEKFRDESNRDVKTFHLINHANKQEENCGECFLLFWVVGNDEGVDENPDKETEDEENGEEVIEEYIPVVSFSEDQGQVVTP